MSLDTIILLVAGILLLGDTLIFILGGGKR